jgi:hypothetical protein
VRRPIPFVLLFLGRSGSTYLIEALDSHPDIRAHGEDITSWRVHPADGQLQCIRNFFEHMLAQPYQCTGFKIKLSDVEDQTGFRAIIIELNARIICLRRKNLIKQVLSWYNASRLYNATSNWNAYRPEDRVTTAQISLDAFEYHLYQTEILDGELIRYVTDLQRPTLSLYYEDLLKDKDDVVRRTLTFLDAPIRLLQGSSIKNTEDDLRQAIRNFDELKARLTGTKYEWMIHN